MFLAVSWHIDVFQPGAYCPQELSNMAVCGQNVYLSLMKLLNKTYSFMSKEHGCFGSLRPEANGIAEGSHSRCVASDEASAKVYPVEIMLFGVHVPADQNKCSSISFEFQNTREGCQMHARYLTYVVGDGIEQASADVFRLPVSLGLPFSKDLAKRAGDG